MLNDQTFEFGQARLRLKSSLRFSMRDSGNMVTYLVEDEITGRFFQIGYGQYVFLTMLDGNRTVSTALMKSASLARENAIDETEAASLCKWAIESGIIQSETGNSTARRIEQLERQERQQYLSYLNPMMLRFKLFNPDPLVTSLVRLFGWMVSPLGLMVWITVTFLGSLQLLRCWGTFVSNRIATFGANDLIWIAVAWVILKLIHETAHSVVCKRYGGRVNSCGVLLLLLIPLPFVDVTSSWRFESKWKRMLVSAAGMMAEVFIAAIACFVWANADPGPLKYHAGNLIISATLHTLIFNVNPLMRFDGYYIMADWLEIRNLAQQGRTWVKTRAKWIFFGSSPSPVNETGFRALAVQVYGVLSMGWFVLIAVGLSLACSSLIEGFGLLVATIGLFMWIGIPTIQLTRFLIWGSETERPNRLRFLLACCCFSLLLTITLGYCPSPTVVSAPLVVDFSEASVVRAKSPGFLSPIPWNDGDRIKKGDLIASLENPDLEFQLNSLLIDIQISKMKINSLHTNNQQAQLQLEQERLFAMIEQREELEAQIADLHLRSPQDGIIIGRELNTKPGTYMLPGDELLTIAEPTQIHAIALAKQTDFEWLRESINQPVSIDLFGSGRWEPLQGVIHKVHPRATVNVPHESFSAQVGGALAVVPRQQVENHEFEQSDEMILVEPRVKLEIKFDDSAVPGLLVGQTGQMRVRQRFENLGQYLYGSLFRFVSKNNFRTHGL